MSNQTKNNHKCDCTREKGQNDLFDTVVFRVSKPCQVRVIAISLR